MKIRPTFKHTSITFMLSNNFLCSVVQSVQSGGWLDIDFALGSFLQKPLATCRDKYCSATGTAQNTSE
jgi:hypothetical protein